MYLESSFRHTSQRTAMAALVVRAGYDGADMEVKAYIVRRHEYNVERKNTIVGLLSPVCSDIVGAGDVTSHQLLVANTYLTFKAYKCFCGIVFFARKCIPIVIVIVIMAAESASKLLHRSVSKVRVCRISANVSRLATASRRSVHQNSRAVAITASSARLRPKLQPLHQPVFLPQPIAASGSRTIFIQTESTPNADVSEHGSG